MILDEILEDKEKELSRLRRRAERLERELGDAPEARDFAAVLRGGSEVAVIAEFKRKSPSAGDIAPGADPAEVARAYVEQGASAVSVLTEGPHFGGSVDDLAAVRGACPCPVLRKDFLVDPLQVLEARVHGADAVLLIVRVLDDEALQGMLEATREAGMEALVEVHSELELERALDAGAAVVGVNARDLDSFAVDLELSERLIADVPDDVAAVAESGIRGEGDVQRMAAAGADAVLVGGWLMSQGPEALAQIAGVPRAGADG